MRASLLQIDVDLSETVADRRDRVAALVRAQAGTDLVVLPELWPVGAFASDTFAAEAEPLDGPTADAMSAAARDAGVWLHAGSIVERAAADSGSAAGDGPLYNTSLVFGPDGELRHTYRKIHRFGFDQGEAALMAPGEEIVTVALPDTVLGLATCYDLRFPEQFRLLIDAGAQMLVISAGWPAKRLEHWRLLARARAVESQTYVLACGTAGTHAGVELAGHSLVIDPWGDIIAEAGPDAQTLTADLDPALVTKTRHDFPVLRDRRLG
ncbi:carbon-nitrogen family hydrolase [Streptomyces sp. H10-C2]|uniref:carbon-nitrogen family hydrolase n=1 Tax=unclassified Streptomyces TaxID=2593676 RepID=UPI0024BBA56A|nr:MULTISPECIES: carbon-nitrogen family hydrolase [unclassified Streptomyces]MDJ0340301.1 carbon-nitrogen family hydrolase [Streptomyces sp. PH10-H1]MDJ0368251.1 carbon-nitrogen family hydrolase [Streptomyces sp. H10-C2]